MATLHVRNVPDDLYERIRQRAAAENRSLSAEVVALLEAMVGSSNDDHSELYDRIQRRRRALQQAVGTFPSSTELLREDRSR